MKKACVMGWPVAQSRSPLIHGFWLRAHGVEGAYDAQPVEPERFPDFARRLPAAGYVGGNVTIPHKEAAFCAADKTDAAAQAVGAANTLWFEDGVLCASNTDVAGFLASMDEQAPGWEAADRACVLGAGGAARAIVQGLIARGIARIDVLNRTPDRARDMAARFGAAVSARPWDERSALAGCAVLVNTTSLGMKGQPPLDIDLSPMPHGAVVSDIVYAPLETPLLRDARLRGLRAVDGLGMLLHQAAPGFERWFGVRPQVTPELRALIVADITGRG
ncbi:MAG: shikimate dehydrogenase [Hyphomicrobiales bacterium]|nr:shikimate dehydrogenase [Hyphomicrobiales bacterium]